MRSSVTVSMLVIILLLNNQVQAQKNDSKFFAGISLGASFPTGAFANKNQQDTIAGLAKPGPTLSVSAGYMFRKWIGVTLLLGGQENKQDPNSFTDALKQEYGDTTRASATTHNWKSGRILAGPVFKIPLSKDGKLLFQSRILAGILKTSVPAYSYTYSTGSQGSLNYFPNEVSFGGISMKAAFCYQVNAGFEYRITKMISLVADIGYFQSEPFYKFDHRLVYNVGTGTTTDWGSFERKFDISTLNAMAGVEIRF